MVQSNHLAAALKGWVLDTHTLESRYAWERILIIWRKLKGLTVLRALSTRLIKSDAPAKLAGSNLWVSRKSIWKLYEVFTTYITLWYFTLSANAHFNRLFNPDLPLKSTTPFGAKITRADSTLETAPPPLFPDPVSRSGPDYLLYYLRPC